MNRSVLNAFQDHAGRVQEFGRRFSLRTRAIAALCAVLAAAVAFWIISGAGTKKERSRPPATVVLATVATKDVAVVEHAAGTVIANTTVQVGAQVSGQLQRAAFKEGDIVKKGDLLFVIDPRPFQAALDQAEAQLAKDRAQLVNAQAAKKRYDRLFAQNAISPQQKDTADATAQSAAATVAADEAEVAAAKLNLGYAEIRSPVNGKTGPILIQPGNLVSANSGSPLVTITEIEPVKVSFALPQSKLAEIQARDKTGTLYALIDARQPGGEKTKAKVTFIGNQVSDATGTIELRASVANTDHRLVPGQLVDVDVALNVLPKAAVVPREAVNEGPNGRFVFVVGKDRIAEMRPVTVLFDDGTLMAVTGVRKGEKIVTDGQLRVVPGAKVSTGKTDKAGKAPQTP